MTIQEIWEDALIHFDEPGSGKYNADGGVFGRRLVNRVYREVCREARCARTSTTLTTTANIREIALPADLVVLEKVLCKPEGYSVGYALERTRFNQIEDEETGPPREYYQVGNTSLGIVPLPDGVYSLTIWYFRGPAAELAETDTPSLVPADWHHVITYGVVYHLYDIDKGDDGSGAVKWERKYRSELQDFKKYLREGCNADQYAGVM